MASKQSRAGVRNRVSIDPVDVARTTLERPVVAARVATRVAIVYDPYLAGRVLERVTGVAETPEGEPVTWTAIVKRTQGAGLQAGRRELAAYRHGIASAAGGPGLRAPKLLAWQNEASEVEVWLEEVGDAYNGQWPVSQFEVVARHIAAWDARAGDIPVPAGFDSEDAWAERHGQPHRLHEALAELETFSTSPAANEAGARLGDPGFARARALITSTPSRIERLATFPQSLLHHDLVRSNLFAVDDSSTVAIDWENVGRGPLGVDLAPLVIGSVRRGEAASEDIGEIESLVLAGYIAGLRDAGIDADREVIRAYGLAVGLRWHVVLGGIGASLDPTRAFRGSRLDEPQTESLRHLVAVSRHILDVADSVVD
jgi:hypothetical protein